MQGDRSLLPMAGNPSDSFGRGVQVENLAFVQQGRSVFMHCGLQADTTGVVFAPTGTEVTLAAFAVRDGFASQGQLVGMQSPFLEVRVQFRVLRAERWGRCV